MTSFVVVVVVVVAGLWQQHDELEKVEVAEAGRGEEDENRCLPSGWIGWKGDLSMNGLDWWWTFGEVISVHP